MDHGQKKVRTKWAYLKIGFHQLLCLLWLGPALTILMLNFRGYVVGASIGSHRCRLNPFSSDTFGLEAKCNKQNHTSLGWLQFASKALEIWFMVVVSDILYDLLVTLSRGDADVPLDFLAIYVQFGDPLSLAHYPKGAKKVKHHAFLALVAVFCPLVNLMAPATAILILPSLAMKRKGDSNTGRI